ncbi:MAG: hypothetical protein ACI9KS_002710 [Sulfitobacter sp.]|jgi:hypothetical protein
MRAGPPRKLSEFEDLTAAEAQLLAEYASGELVVIGDGGRPGASAGPERQVRANLIRYLLLGGCDELDAPVHEKGVRVAGARVIDALDLDGCDSKIDLGLINCHFDERPNLLSARLASVILSGSELPGLRADGLIATGDVSLNEAKSTSEVRLLGAQIGGDLNCNEATLKTRGTEIAALNADGLSVTGTVFLRKAEVIGGVRLLGAQIGRDFSCIGAQFTAREGGQDGRGTALTIDGAKITGSFFLREGASIKGILDMTAAEIGSLHDDPICWPGPGNLALNRCRYGAFTGTGITAQERIDWLGLQDPTQFDQDFWPQPWEQCAKVLREMGHRNDARLVLIDKEERQREWMRRVLKSRLDGARIRGDIERAVVKKDLEKLRSLAEAADQKLENWPKAAPGKADFHAQVSKVSGFAKKLPEGLTLPPEIAKLPPDHIMAARDSIVRTWAELQARRIWDQTLSIFLGYGYAPSRAFGWLVFAWLLGVYIFAVAWGQGAFKPNNPFILRSPEWAYCAPDYTPLIQHEDLSQHDARNPGDQSQLACFQNQPEANAFLRFNPWTYSADTLLPIVSLEMQQNWIPDESAEHPAGQRARIFLWLQIAFGWALSLLAVAGFSGLVRND